MATDFQMTMADAARAALGMWPEFHELTFERSEDWALIKRIATHPRIYPSISDDFSPKREEWEPFKGDEIWYLVARDNGEVLGMFALIQSNKICWQVHTCMLPSSWGELALRAAKEATEWVWKNSPCLRLITEVPAYNRIALHFAKSAGMTEYGVNPTSYMHAGKLWDVTLLGVSKPCL